MLRVTCASPGRDSHAAYVRAMSDHDDKPIEDEPIPFLPETEPSDLPGESPLDAPREPGAPDDDGHPDPGGGGGGRVL